MSQLNDATSEVEEEEEEDAYLDLEDPENKILDDGEEAPAPGGDGSSDSGSDGGGGAGDPANDPEGSPRGEAVPDPNAVAPINLNLVDDVEPPRDDAIATFTPPPHEEGRKAIHVVRTAPSGSSVAAAGEADVVYVMTCITSPADDGAVTATIAPVATLTGHTDTITRLEYSPNGEYLASGGLDSIIKIWSTSTWEVVHTLTDMSGEVEVLLWHPSSQILFAAGNDGQGAMWNVKKGTVAMFFGGHRGSMSCAKWAVDYKKIVTASSDGSVIFFSPKTGEAEVTIAKEISPDQAGISQILVLSDDIVVVGCDDGTIHLVSYERKKCVAHLRDIHEQCIESLELGGAGLPFYVSASCDAKVVVWNVSDHSARCVLSVGEGVIPAVWCGPLVVVGCSDGSLRCWDGRSMPQDPLATCFGHRRMVLSVAVVAQELKLIATASDDGTIKFFMLKV